MTAALLTVTVGGRYGLPLVFDATGRGLPDAAAGAIGDAFRQAAALPVIPPADHGRSGGEGKVIQVRRNAGQLQKGESEELQRHCGRVPPA